MGKKTGFIKKLFPGTDVPHDPNITVTHDQTFANGAVRFNVTSNTVSPVMIVGGNVAISEGNDIYQADTDYASNLSLSATGSGVFDVNVYQGNVTLTGQVRDVAEYSSNVRAETSTVTVTGLTSFELGHAQNAEVFISNVTCSTVLPTATNVTANLNVAQGAGYLVSPNITVDSSGNVMARTVILEPNTAYTVEFINSDRSNTSIDTSFQANATLSPFFTAYDPAYNDGGTSSTAPLVANSSIFSSGEVQGAGALALSPYGQNGRVFGAPITDDGTNKYLVLYDAAEEEYEKLGNGFDANKNMGTFSNTSVGAIDETRYYGAVTKQDGRTLFIPGHAQIGTLSDAWAQVCAWECPGDWANSQVFAQTVGTGYGNLATTYSVDLGNGTTYINRNGAALSPKGDVYSAPVEESRIFKFTAATSTIGFLDGENHANVAITRLSPYTNNRIKGYSKPVTAANGNIYMAGYAHEDVLELNTQNDTYDSWESLSNITGSTRSFTCGCLLDEDNILFVGEKWTNNGVRDIGDGDSTQDISQTEFLKCNITSGSYTLSSYDTQTNSGNALGRGGAVSCQRGWDGDAYVVTPSGTIIRYDVSTDAKAVVYTARDTTAPGGNSSLSTYTCTNAILDNTGNMFMIPPTSDGSSNQRGKSLVVKCISTSGLNTWPQSAYNGKN
tara:strand:- start:5274 stop:7286 length:2013 start_codon:yes stop_codon:yes gene_type:complete